MAAYDNDRGSVASFDDVDEFDDFAGESASFSSRGSAARGRGSRRVTIARGDGDDDEEEEDEDGNGHDGRRQRSPMIVPFPVDRDVRLVQELLQRATMGKKKNDDDKKDDHKLTCAEETQPENPDIRYTLRYTSRRGPDVDVMHSAEPIELDLDGIEGLSEATRAAAAHKPQPVIEVFTRVASNLGRSPLGMTSAKDAMHRYRLPPPPPPPGPHTRYYSPDTDSLDTYQQRHLRYAPPPLPQLGVLELHSTFLAIRSPHLASALRAVVEYYPAMPLHGPIPSIPAPYEVLYHHRDALARYKTRQPEAHGAEYALTTARHIDVLLRFLDQEAWGQKVRDEEALHRRAPLPLATADNLWMLYKPGELVFGKYCGKWSAFVVTQFTRGGPIASGPTLAHRVHTWKLQYSGESFNRISHDFQVEAFRGEQAITSLAVIPARFFRGSDGDQEPADVLAEHVRLGKLMWRLMQGPAYMSYEGNLATAHEGDDDEWSHSTNTTGFMSGRVMVDCSGNDSFNYRQEYDTRRRTRCGRAAAQVHTVVADSLPYFAARCDCEACGRSEAEPGKSPFAGFEGVRPKVDEMPATDLYFAVIHKVVDGFILGERRWALFNVDQLREVQFDREAFKFLVLDDEIKMTVRALIGKFASVQGHVSPWPNDFVRNKGQGRIFLLHGSPGVGKTCTAEATAELARRPLISLTAGDLGRHGQGVERSLDYFLKLGERFGAIVLIDEADVYLERRRTSDIARNGLVSVFLRALEYYRGVLFLTTNRVETFDAAFTSRIHVALHYGPLTDEHREKIWLNSFERLERDSEGKVHVSVATREYVYDSRDVRSLEWNGREIRNALQTAVALAETEALGDDFGSMGSDDRNSAAARTHHDKITVTDKHLRAVVKMSRGFKVFAAERQMQDRFGDDDDVSAKNDYDDDESDRTSIICG